MVPRRRLNGSFPCHNVYDGPLEPSTLDPSANSRAEARRKLNAKTCINMSSRDTAVLFWPPWERRVVVVRVVIN